MSNEISKQRTDQQRKSIFLYCKWVADELNQQGQTLQNVVSKINKVEIRPTKENIKEVVWNEIMKAMFKKDSTTFLTKSEVSEVYNVMAVWIAKNFGIDLPFPVNEERQYQKANGIDMPILQDNYK